MKKTKQYLSLPVMGVENGEQLGKVEGLLVNPGTGRIDYVLLDRQFWYGEMRALPYDAVLGIGEFALTTRNGQEIAPVGAQPEVITLLDKDVKVINAGVMTRSGELVGVVTEYYIDEKTGKVAGCELSQSGNGGIAGIIPAEKIITFGSKYIVIEDNPETFLGQDMSDQPGVTAQPRVEQSEGVAGQETAGSAEPEDPVELFELRQRQFLLGKKAVRKITGPGGRIIVEEGARITEEIIEKALAADKYIELTMNVTE